VLNPIDFNFNDGAARHPGQQDAAQRIAQCMPKATLKGFEDNPRMTPVMGGNVNRTRGKQFCR